MLFYEINPETWDIWAIQLEGENRKPQEFLLTQARENAAQFSPDGRWVAYTSNESGQFEVYVRPFPEREPRTLVGAGWEPVWASDGTELFYLSPGGEQLMVAAVTGSGPNLVVGNSTLLVDDWPGQSMIRTGYDVSADGRFLTVVQIQPAPPPNEITVVLNWVEELKRLVPTGE